MPKRCAFVLAILCGLSVYGTSAFADAVQTESGLVAGVEESGLHVFKGIPYSAPPVGDLRWREPQPAPLWQGVRNADAFSPICPQTRPYPPEAPPEAQSEDCLTLNVWTPAQDASAKLPVMVWIYGGGLEGGTASTPLYWGDKLAARGLVVVTFNYRLGVFGFLAHPELSAESEHKSSGNYGLLDQIAALGWVHRNVSAFGGDPEQVTVFGQSSGSISISTLATSPLAKGLFQRAIGESGSLFEPVELDATFALAGAEQAGAGFVQRAGATSIADLRAMPVDQLLKIPFRPHFNIDGYALIESPYDAYRKRHDNGADLLIGSNANEGELFLAGKSVTTANFKDVLARDFPGVLISLIGPRPGANDAEAHASAAAFEGDMRFRYDMWKWANLATEAGHRVYLYRFARVPPFVEGDRYFGMGATHGMEMPYVFDHLDQQSVAWQDSDRTLAKIMSAYWTNFAISGDPNGEGLPQWQAFDPAQGKLMALDETVAVSDVTDEGRLRRIDFVYSGARLVMRHPYAVLVAAAVVMLGIVAGIVLGIRWWLRRRALGTA